MDLENQLNMERRLATLEANHLNMKEAFEKSEQASIRLTAAVEELHGQFSKYETRWGWITMFATAIGGALIILKDYVLDFFVGSNK